MTEPILYSFRRCPFAMRARMAIAASGIRVELRELILKNKPAHMLEISPKGTVPVLLLPDGSVLEESLDVAYWALNENDPANWLAPWKDDATAASKLVERFDGSFKHHLDRYKYASRYDDVDEIEHRAAGQTFLKELDERLVGKDWLHGGQITFLDAAIAPFVRQFRIPDPQWFDRLPYVNLNSWLFRFMDAPEFLCVMHKYPLWKEGDASIFFPDE